MTGTAPRVLVMVKGLGLGGVERLLSESIPHLNRERFDYEFCYFTPWKDDVVPEFRRAGIPIHCLGIANDATPRNIRKVRSFLVAGSYDIVHTHSPFPSALTRLLAPRDGLAGIVHTEHSLPGSRNWVTRVANRLTYPLCDVVISVSRVVESEVGRGWPFEPRDSRVIYGGIEGGALSGVTPAMVADTRRSLEIPEGDLVVGNVAHLRRQKGHDLWLETARLVLDEKPNTTFVIVGREKEPGYQRALQEHAAALGMEDRVRFTGFQLDPYPYLATFDVFLMASEFEGFPIALVEAMGMGVAVVSTDVGGVSEAIGSEPTGLMAPKGDATALAAQVVSLLDDANRREALAGRARARARSEFTVERMVELVEQVYDELLSS
jgi:glycosyltransferase involved in cell wall biosynthesis